MENGRTKSGFKYKIDENKLRSWEFVKLAKALSKDETGALVTDYIEFVLGDDQAQALAEHSVHDGYSDIRIMLEEVTEIIRKVTDSTAKKSQPLPE